MQIIFYNYGGKSNTIVKILPQPTATYEGTLRQGVSLLSPSMFIEEHSFDKLRFVNYAYIQEFDRYYFVTNISVATEGLIQIDRKEDVLMTYQGIVQQSHGIVARTSSPKLYNEWYPDNRRPASGEYRKLLYGLGGNTHDAIGSFITNNKGNDRFLYPSSRDPNAVKYYVVYTYSKQLTQLTGTTIPQDLKDVLYRYTSGQKNDEISTTEGMGSGAMTVIACNFSAVMAIMRWANTNKESSAIVSVYYIPFELPHDAGALPSITVGSGDDKSVISFDNAKEEYAYSVTNSAVRKLFDITIQKDRFVDTHYLYAKWKMQKDKMRIWLPFSGWYDLNLLDLQITKRDVRIQCFYLINPFKGTATVYVTDYTNKRILYTSDVTISVTVPMVSSNEQANQDALNKSITTSVIKGFVSLASLIALIAIPGISAPRMALGGASAVGNIYSSVASPILTANTLHDQEQVSNYTANTYNYRYLDPVLEYTIYDLAFPDTGDEMGLYINNNGLPSNRDITINSLYQTDTGETSKTYYFQMSYVVIPMTYGTKTINTDELETLKNLLRKGVYTQDVQA